MNVLIFTWPGPVLLLQQSVGTHCSNKKQPAWSPSASISVFKVEDVFVCV